MRSGAVLVAFAVSCASEPPAETGYDSAPRGGDEPRERADGQNPAEALPDDSAIGVNCRAAWRIAGSVA